MPRGRRKKRKIIFSFAVIVFIIFLDQIVKNIVEENLISSETIPLIKNFLHITYVKNTGILFGLLKGYNFAFIVISLITILFIFLFFLFVESKFYTQISLLLISAGAISNLIDRIIRGYIVDFIDLRVWPVFNIADICITIGTVIIVLEIFKTYFEKSHN